MMFAQHVKHELFSLINDMASCPCAFVRDPSRDFTRKRKLDFGTMIHCILSMESGSLQKELLDFFQYDPQTPSSSAFVQQRDKLLPDAFFHLFNQFNQCFPEEKTYRGYRLIACDGTDLNIPLNPDDEDTYFQSSPDTKGFNLYHLDAMYDLCSRRYSDIMIMPRRKANERRSMAAMVDRSKFPEKTIFIADRGYESYNTFAHVMEKHMYYLIRAKDQNSCSILSGLNLPGQEEFDIEISIELTRKHTNAIKAQPERYKRLTTNHGFDYLDLKEHLFYPITLRVLRFAITENTYECIITNLPKEEFCAEEIKKVYAMRWGIETSFRELKHTIGLSCFHSKKVEHIRQEIYSRLILYNYCEIITMNVVIHQKDTKYVYQINYTVAIYICRYFLRNDIPPPHVEMLIQRNLLPIRPGRSDPRKVRPKSVVSFLYRIT